MWPKLPQGNRLWLFAAACGHSRPSAAKLDFGHTKIVLGVEEGR